MHSEDKEHFQDWSPQDRAELVKAIAGFFAGLNDQFPDMCTGCRTAFILEFIMQGARQNGMEFEDGFLLINRVFESEIKKAVGQFVKKRIVTPDDDKGTIH